MSFRLHLIINLSSPREADFVLRHPIGQHMRDIHWRKAAKDRPCAASDERAWAMVTFEPSVREGFVCIDELRKVQPHIGVVVSGIRLSGTERAHLFDLGADLIGGDDAGPEELMAMMEAVIGRLSRRPGPALICI